MMLQTRPVRFVRGARPLLPLVLAGCVAAGLWTVARHGASAAGVAGTPAAGMSLALTSAVPAVVGRAEVIDGDTIHIGSTRIRLEGIDAPEIGQTCQRAWLRFATRPWNCGLDAQRRLAELVGRNEVTCAVKGRDKYGRALAVCSVGSVDVNARLVREGLAWAFVKYSETYVAEEAAARERGLGVWQVPNTPAWDHRAGHWRASEQQAPQGCAIKGNISRNGRIYHMPWSPWYGKVTVEPSRGERWFCSEEEAIRAGFRPAGPAQKRG